MKESSTLNENLDTTDMTFEEEVQKHIEDMKARSADGWCPYPDQTLHETSELLLKEALLEIKDLLDEIADLSRIYDI